MIKRLTTALGIAMLILGVAFGTIFVVVKEASAVGSRNCDVSAIPFAVDVNKIYDPQFSGWREAMKGDSLSLPLNIGNAVVGRSYVIEVNDLPDGITCLSGTSPKLTGIFQKAGTWYSHFWVHYAGSTVKTDFNRGVIVFKVYDVNDVNLPYIEVMCGN